jgi:hypothetical protein
MIIFKTFIISKFFLFCLWSNLFWILKWDFVFIVFICRTIFFTILRFATFTFFRTIFFRKYSCKTSKRLLARKLFNMSSYHCSFKTSKYAINWAIDWLFRWWDNLIFCFYNDNSKFNKINLLFQKIAKLFSKRNWFRCFIESQSIFLSNSIEFWNIVT